MLGNRAEGVTANTRQYPGLLAHAAVWNIALDASQRQALATGARPDTVAAANLRGWWPGDTFQDGGNTWLEDHSGNGNHLLIESAQWVDDSPPVDEAPAPDPLQGVRFSPLDGTELRNRNGALINESVVSYAVSLDRNPVNQTVEDSGTLDIVDGEAEIDLSAISPVPAANTDVYVTLYKEFNGPDEDWDRRYHLVMVDET